MSRLKRPAMAVTLWLSLMGCGPTPAPTAPLARAENEAPVAAGREQADPAPVEDGDVTEAWVHGLHVLVKRIPVAGAVATQLYIRGGARNWGATDAGVEMLAVRSSVSGGTERMDKDTFSRRLSDLGSALDGQTNADFSVFSAWSLNAAWDETFELLVEAFRHPALPATEVEVVRQEQLSQLAHETESPDGKLSLLVQQGIYRGHPYQHRAIGTVETVRALSVAALREHLARLRETSRLLLVVVGDVDAQHVLARTQALLGDLPRGQYVAEPMPRWSREQGEVNVVAQSLPTNYIQSVFPGPTWRDPDFPVALVAMNTLGLREFEEVRTKRNLSYAPAAFLSLAGELTLGALSVTATDPRATMQVMLDEAARLRREPVPARELQGIESMLLTRLFMAAEAPSDQASLLARWQLYGDDFRLVRHFPERVRGVTSADVQAWAGQHLQHLSTFVLGDPSAIDTAALTAF